MTLPDKLCEFQNIRATYTYSKHSASELQRIKTQSSFDRNLVNITHHRLLCCRASEAGGEHQKKGGRSASEGILTSEHSY